MEQHSRQPCLRLFRSFWSAGFEGACHINRQGKRLDMLASTQHDRQALQDYQLLRGAGILTARDGVRWHRIERAGTFNFSSFTPMLEASRRAGIQVIWNLCHYGWPEDVDVLAPSFVDRFARYCAAVARVVAGLSADVPFYSPINEISFLCWAVGRKIIHPFAGGRDDELKCNFVRAAIAGCEAIWAVDRRARIVHADPIIHVVPPRSRPDLREAAARQRASQFAAWDMLAGRDHPELGGHPRYLDIVGVNFYHANQWEYPDVRIRWEDNPRDDRWVPLHRLLAEVWQRYRRPLFIAETSHFGVGRAPWLQEIAAEAFAARQCGVPLEGVCIYPILDRPDWENPYHWHNSGLWDMSLDGSGRLVRVLNQEYAAAFRAARDLIGRDPNC
jgi:UDP-galactopyranose mutase